MNKVLITGSTQGIGRATAIKFLASGYEVYGMDIQESSIEHENYHHVVCDVSGDLPELPEFDIIINNAGVQQSGHDIETNLIGLINVTEKYAFHEGIKSVVNIASTSAHTGEEFPLYSASKGGVLTYTKNAAYRLAALGATCNSLSPGGVITPLNNPVLVDENKWKQIMKVTPLKKWATSEEIAEWIYFITVVNKSMTGEDIIIDNGEHVLSNFIW